jgi:hypothetical protein
MQMPRENDDMNKDNFKLPKQWKHWVRSAGLRFDGFGKYKRSRHNIYSMRGHGRHWRVNCHGEFQCSEPYAGFDRWANSHQETFQMPKTKDAFVSLVKGYVWL